MSGNKKDTIDLLVDIKGILRECPRNPMDALILQKGEMINILAEKTVNLIRRIYGEVQTHDANYLYLKILKDLKPHTNGKEE